MFGTPSLYEPTQNPKKAATSTENTWKLAQMSKESYTKKVWLAHVQILKSQLHIE